MANTKTAKKQLLITARNHQRNQHYTTMLKTALKKARLAITGSDAKSALTIATKGTGTAGQTNVGGIVIHGALKSLTAGTTNLLGDLTAG